MGLRVLLVVVVTSACGRFGIDEIASGGPSCASLPATCGPSGDQSCCDSRVVPGGTYLRGYDVATDNMYTDMTRPATLSSFRLDRYEVTVGRFRAFVMAGEGTQQHPPDPGAGAHPKIANSGWDPLSGPGLAPDATALAAALKCDPIFQTWTDTPGSGESRPIVCITWYEAMAFCAWDGGFLPTEAEWHSAASGGSAQRAQPWSDPAGDIAVDCDHANFDPGTSCVSAGTSDVGARSPAGDGAFGHADLAGNAAEWVLDWFAGYANPCNDCANVFPAAQRVIRGGSFNDPGSLLRVAHRASNVPSSRFGYVGVRCARPQ